MVWPAWHWKAQRCISQPELASGQGNDARTCTCAHSLQLQCGKKRCLPASPTCLRHMGEGWHILLMKLFWVSRSAPELPSREGEAINPRASKMSVWPSPSTPPPQKASMRIQQPSNQRFASNSCSNKQRLMGWKLKREQRMSKRRTHKTDQLMMEACPGCSLRSLLTDVSRRGQHTSKRFGSSPCCHTPHAKGALAPMC